MSVLLEELLIKASNGDKDSAIELVASSEESLNNFAKKQFWDWNQREGAEDAVGDLVVKILNGDLQKFSASNSISKSFKKHLEKTCKIKIKEAINLNLGQNDELNLNQLLLGLKREYDASVMNQVISIVEPYLVQYAATANIPNNTIDDFFKNSHQIISNFSASAYLRSCLQNAISGKVKRESLNDSTDDENTKELTDKNQFEKKSFSQIQRKEKYRIVIECINKIELEEHRLILKLSYFCKKVKELGEKELSEILSDREKKTVPVGTVKSRKAAAIKKFSRNLLLRIGLGPENVDYYSLVLGLIDPVFFGKKVPDKQQHILTKMGIEEDATNSMKCILTRMGIDQDKANQMMAFLQCPVDFDCLDDKEKAKYKKDIEFKINAILFSHFGLNLSDWISS